MIGRMAERWYVRLSQIFEHQLALKQPIILYVQPAAFPADECARGGFGEGTGGVTHSSGASCSCLRGKSI